MWLFNFTLAIIFSIITCMFMASGKTTAAIIEAIVVVANYAAAFVGFIFAKRKSTVINQCDGCRAKMGLRKSQFGGSDMHYHNNRVVMICEKYRYTDEYESDFQTRFNHAQISAAQPTREL